MSVLIAPSILSADFARLGEAVAAAERGGADLIHVDVMDGHFVPNISIGVPVVKSLKRIATVPLDVHLMIADPDRYIEAFADAGAGMMSVHVEAVRHIHRTVQAIKALGVKAGVVINPGTPVVALAEIAGDVDFVLVMSVNPGFGGQTFIPRSESKLREVRALLDAAGNHRPIEIDGGVDQHNIARVVAVSAPATVSRVRVRYAETDKMGVVYYANYFVWFEVGRTDLLRASGWNYRDMETEGFGLPVIEAQCSYRESAKYDDEIEVKTTGELISPVRVKFSYEVVRSADAATLATGSTVHATLDRNGRPCRLPERVRQVLS
jgi:ribulose-phosphate 3-epimerase